MSLLVLGGARSGKSRFAQVLVESEQSCGRRLVYVATAQARDDEMERRIAVHVAGRDARWRTVSEPFELAKVVEAEARNHQAVLVDCLTLWLTNIMLRGDDVEVASGALAALTARLSTPVVYVSNEVGAGIVPDNALARRFRDAQGRLNQLMAAVCSKVVFVAAGLPLMLKPAALPDDLI